MEVESTLGTLVPMLVLCLICACGAQAVTMLNVAHRGLWKEANLPQNTVEAIAAAYAAGAAVVETDFVETKSGEMICLHDRNALATMSTVVKDPAEITAADRAVINLGEKMGLPRPYRIPLLADVLAVVPKDRMIQAEIKVYGPTYARQFDAAVRAAGLCETNVLVSSFNHEALKDFHGKYPKYRTLWLGCGITSKGFVLDDVIARAKDGGFDIVCPGCGDARKAGFARADADRIRAAGFDFRVYGVNDEKLLDYAAGLGASGFTCNHFKAAYEWARRRGDVTLLPAAEAVGPAAEEESHVRPVVARILDNVRKLRVADPEAVPMAFWDFDGTIICGDSGIGYVEDGVIRYKGLIEEVIDAGFLPMYRGEGGYRKWWRDYTRMTEIGPWLAQGYDAQMFTGVSAAEVDAFCQKRIREMRLDRWYFASSMAIWKALADAGVENYVVSANIEALVRNTAFTLGIPPDRIRGARTELDGGRWTTRLLQPIPHGEGKADIVRNLVRARPHGAAIAAFGNSYATDGAFLRDVATQTSLPGGAAGTAMMINGGKSVPGLTEHFICVEQRRTAGSMRPPVGEIRRGRRRESDL